MSRILITGAAGFIGSHLTDKLIRDHEIIACDNCSTGTKRNLTHLHANPNFEFIRHDINFPLFVEVDEIYNLACPASPIHYQRDPVQTIKCNTHGMINLLGLAKRTNAKLLQASTSEVYGDPNTTPQPETYHGDVNPIGPRACYDESKRCAETLCMDYHRQYKLDVKIARIFNTYGPRMQINDGRVISNFIIQALTNQPITICGSGQQTRSFCYVDDLIIGLMRLMATSRHCTGPINLGNPIQEITIIDLARTIIDMTKSKSEITHIKLPQDDPKQRCPDIRYAKTILDFHPATHLIDGLIETIDYFRREITR